jgi:hypothetical protein
MSLTFRHYFIPHEANNYHPHILHTKRVVLYGALGLAAKFIVAFFVLALPLSAYMAPDMLKAHADKIITLVNELRVKKGERALSVPSALALSSRQKAEDMARYQYFGHSGPDGRTVVAWVADAGYDYEFAGENLAIGFSAPEDVVRAWKESPTHYANLVDVDFKDVGVGIQNGEYEGVQTEYIAMHFGGPRSIPSTQRITPPSLVAPKKSSDTQTKKTSILPKKKEKQDVAGVRASQDMERVVYDKDQSRVYWKEQKNGTELSARAVLGGSITSATVFVGSASIQLQKQEDGWYTGTATISQTPDDLFRTTVTPSIRILGMSGETIEDGIEWNTIQVARPSPIKKYSYVKSIPGPAAPLFSLSQVLYRGLILFFGIALFLCIVVEYKKQHPHVIAQTLALIGLFALLLNT